MPDDVEFTFTPPLELHGIPLVVVVISTQGSELVPLPTMGGLDVAGQLDVVPGIVRALRHQADTLEAKAGLVRAIEDLT